MLRPDRAGSERNINKIYKNLTKLIKYEKYNVTIEIITVS